MNRFHIKNEDWECSDPECGSINFARRETCYRCSKERGEDKKKKIRQEIGKLAASKSQGLFVAGDWQCDKCDNINWARRRSCNMCNAPKYVEVEERTGYGGGYNDRGIVEYIERAESDDDCDEFGRKKRKKINEDKSSKKICISQIETDNEVEDEEDEEEDLSKYDLIGWIAEKKGEAQTNANDDTEENNSSSLRSRTSSPSSSAPSK